MGKPNLRPGEFQEGRAIDMPSEFTFVIFASFVVA
jgi:hypothetical protein